MNNEARMVRAGLELNDENAEVRMTFGTLKILGFPEGVPGISINVGRCLTISSRKWISSIASLRLLPHNYSYAR
jgi:hypothetical protein